MADKALPYDWFCLGLGWPWTVLASSQTDADSQRHTPTKPRSPKEAPSNRNMSIMVFTKAIFKTL